MIFEIQGPDGKTYEVEGPEGASPQEAVGILQKQIAGNSDLNRARVVGTEAVQGLTDVARLPYHLAQGADWLLGKLGPEMKASAEARREWRRQNLPSVTEKVESLGIPTDPEAEAKRLGVKRDDTLKALGAVARTAAGTAAMGGGILPSLLAGAGAGTGQAVGGDTGEIIGALAGPLVGARFASTAARKAAGRATPSAGDLALQADDAFARMRQAGAVVSPQALARLDSRIAADMGRQNFRPAVHTQTATVLKELSDDILQGPATYRTLGNFGRPGVQGPLSFEQLHGFRQVVNEGIKKSVPASADARLLSRIKSKLDDFLGNLTQADVVAGNPLTAAAALKEGTAAYRKYAKSQEIAQLLEKARSNAPGFSQTGMDKAIRDQFKQLANNPRRMRLFSPAEQAQIRMVARSTKPMNVLRFFGGMSPKGALTGVAHAANIAANPAVGLPLAGALSAARVAASRSRMNAVRDLDELVRAGQQIQAPPVLPLAVPGLAAVGANYLSR